MNLSTHGTWYFNQVELYNFTNLAKVGLKSINFLFSFIVLETKSSKTTTQLGLHGTSNPYFSLPPFNKNVQVQIIVSEGC